MNNSIRDYLINIYDKLSHKSTLLNGIALFKYLIKKEFYTFEKCNYIIKDILEQTNKLTGEDKKELLILLPYFFTNQTSLKYIKKILYILFAQINHTTENIIPSMGKIFGDILINVQNLDTSRKESNLLGQNRNEYESILLKFCLDLIQNEKNNNEFMLKSKYYYYDFSLNIYQQKCGFVFLEQFINNYKDLANDNITLNIILNTLNTHFEFLKNKNFVNKVELLKCINKLINKLQDQYSPYAKDLFNEIYNLFDKTLSFSGINIKSNIDFDLKKYLFDIIYSLLLYNKESIKDYLPKILSYAKINKINMNKEIRSISLKIINLINNKEELNTLYNTNNNNKINNNTNFNYNTNIYINNFLTNDSTKFDKINNNNRYKERALSYKNCKMRGSQIKQMIDEDKKKYGDKKQNKNFIFVSQSPKKESNINKNKSINKSVSNSISISNITTFRNKENNSNNKTNNLDLVNLKVYEIKNMNDTMIKTVDNIENYLSNNFTNIELKLNKIDNFQDKYQNNKNLLDEKINDIILNDEQLFKFMNDIEEKDINNISLKIFEEIINRFMILILVNKNNKEIFESYLKLLNKLLNCKKLEFNGGELSNTSENNNFQKYKISFNLENNLQYLYKSLNILNN